jgi:hypothetical protein
MDKNTMKSILYNDEGTILYSAITGYLFEHHVMVMLQQGAQVGSSKYHEKTSGIYYLLSGMYIEFHINHSGHLSVYPQLFS